MTAINYNQIKGAQVNVLDFIPRTEHAGIAARTSSYDCHDAILAAIAALPHPSATVYFPNGKYCSSDLVIPANGSATTAAGMSFVGDGGGGYNTTQIYYTGTSGILFDFSAFTVASASAAHVYFKDLFLNSSAGATAGTAIKMANCTYSRFENLNVQYFNIGIELTDYSFYSTFKRVEFRHCYTYGLKSAGDSLLNGAKFDECLFSLTDNGVGAYIEYPGQAIEFDHCFFEGNSSSGIRLLQAQVVKFRSCYFEDNGAVDLSVVSDYSNAGQKLSLDSCYFDDDLTQTHRRVFLQQCLAVITNCEFGATLDTNPPIQVVKYTNKPLGSQPMAAMGNNYPTAKITDDESNWTIVDTKHPSATFAAAVPTNTMMQKGSIVWNTNPATNIYQPGWLCSVTGMTGAVLAIVPTATTSAGSKTVTLSAANHTIQCGDALKIAGETFASDAFAIVLRIDPANGTLLTVDKAADTGVAAAAVSYNTATIVPLKVAQVTRTASATTNTVICTSTLAGGTAQTANHSIVVGADHATQLKTFVDVVLWMTNVAGEVLLSGASGIETGTPAARTYAVNGLDLELSMAAAAAYDVSVSNTIHGIV